jgi:hypothetical protein
VVSRPIRLGVKFFLGPKISLLLLSDSCGFVDVDALSDESTGLSFVAAVVSSTCHLYLIFYLSASQFWCQALSGTLELIYVTVRLFRFCQCGRLLLREDGFVIYRLHSQ